MRNQNNFQVGKYARLIFKLKFRINYLKNVDITFSIYGSNESLILIPTQLSPYNQISGRIQQASLYYLDNFVISQ